MSDSPTDDVVSAAGATSSAESPASGQGSERPAEKESTAGVALSVIDKVLGQAADAGGSPTPERDKVDGDAPSTDEASAQETPADASEDDSASEVPDPTWSERSKRRFERLVAERRQAIEERDRAVAAAAQLDQFVRAHGLTMDQVNEQFKLAATVASDPHAAIEHLERMLADLRQRTALPDDLRAKVEVGAIDEASASELARARAQAARLEQQIRERAEAEARQRREAEQASVVAALDAWEAQWRTKDPGYTRARAELVASELSAALAAERLANRPINAAKAIELANAAKATVEKRLSALVPKKPVQPPVTSGRVAQAAPQLKTALDVINHVLAR